ncbi:MAG TPA: SPW repeat protein [Stellaceae bacterium]|nr:SPW repeat protein [Stellaceae bacterium]
MTIRNPNQLAAESRSAPHDWLIAIAALWLFISPWVLGFSGAVSGPANGPGVVAGSRAAWDAWIVGAVTLIIALAQARSFAPARFKDRWVEIVLAIWIFIAPWVLGFTTLPAASWDHWIVGVAVFAFAAAKYSTRRTVAAPLGSEPGLSPTSDPMASPQNQPPGNLSQPRDQRRAGGR